MCCREKWNTMLSLMAAREQKLLAAGEIHAFNRDVADALARIQEKLNSIPDTVGRVGSTLNYQSILNPFQPESHFHLSCTC